MTKGQNLQTVIEDIQKQQAELDLRQTVLTRIDKFRADLEGRGMAVSIGVNGNNVNIAIDLGPPAALPPPDPAPAAPSDPAPAAPAPKASGPFSDTENEKILQLHDEGFGGEDIATKTGRRVNVIILQLRRLLKKREAEPPAKDLPEPSQTPDPEPMDDPEPVKPPHVQAVPPQVKIPPSGVPPLRPEGHPLTVPEWAIYCHIEQLPPADQWTAERDLDLCRGVFGGRGIDVVAAGLHISMSDARARFHQLNGKPGDLDHQSRLMAALKFRAEARPA